MMKKYIAGQIRNRVNPPGDDEVSMVTRLVKRTSSHLLLLPHSSPHSSVSFPTLYSLVLTEPLHL